MVLLYPGSFDPVTYGHIDVARRGAKLADRLIISVVDNPNKTTLFSVEQRMGFLQSIFGDSINVEVDSFCGLLADYARCKGATAILRGLRTLGDFETESAYAAANALLSEIDTIFIAATPSLCCISSSIVREAASYVYSSGSNESGEAAIGAMVPPSVQVALKGLIRA